MTRSRAQELHTAFTRALTDAPRRAPLGGGWLPDRLAQACVQVLPISGAGVSVTFTADRRLPVGAANPPSAVAERLQFTLGDGPCFSTERTRRSVCASDQELSRRWPRYWAKLQSATPFRSVVCLPVGGPLAHFAALSLFFAQPQGAAALEPTDAVLVADLVSRCLADDLTGSQMAATGDVSPGRPAWLATPSIDQRQLVWQAIGLLNGQNNTTSEKSMAALRERAATRGIDVETAASQVLDEERPTARND